MAAAHKELEALGVRVLAGTPVTEVTSKGVQTASGEFIPADLRVWAAGVRAPSLLKDLDGLETNRADQLVVNRTLQTTGDERIFAMGDCCACPQPSSDRPVPPRAQAAHQMADTVFENLKRLIAGKPLNDFVYHDHGSLVSLSRFSTVGSLIGNLIGGRMAVEGRLARFVYVSLYRMHLMTIHGRIIGLAFILMSRLNQVVRPKLKLH